MYVVFKVQTLIKYLSNPPLAQSVEHAAVNRSVVGSSPTGGSFFYAWLNKELFTGYFLYVCINIRYIYRNI